MKRCFLLLAALVHSLLAPRLPAAAQFVELTAELEINDWSYWFLEDKDGWAARREKPASSVFTKPAPMRLVVGTNSG